MNLKKTRSIGENLSVSANFIRENFMSIMKATLVVVILPLLFGAILIGFSMSNMYSDLANNMQNPGAYNPLSTFAGLMPGYLIIGISSCIFYIMCVSYIKHYVNRVEDITRSMLLDDVKKNIIKVIFGGILLAFLMTLGFMLCFFPGIYLSVVFAHIFAIAIIEAKDFGTSFSRAFKIIKGKWWESFLLFFITYIISLGLAFIIVIPMYAILGISMFSASKTGDPSQIMESMSSIMSWIMPLYILMSIVITLLFTTVSSVNYYSMVEEKEGLGERDDINNIGQ